MCVCAYVCVTDKQVPVDVRREDFNTPETATTGGWKLPDVGAGNQMWVLCKSIKGA